MTMINKLDAFKNNLPAKFQLTKLNMYILKDQHTLGAVFSLHLLFNAAIFDLTRISLAGFNFPLAAAFRHAPRDFVTQCQQRCRFHAMVVSDTLREGFIHQGAGVFDDFFCADVALESAKIQIIYSATVDNADECREGTKNNLQANLKLLKLIHTGKQGISPYVSPSQFLFG